MKINFAFFGTDPLALPILNKLETIGFIPSLVVTTPNTKDKKGNPIIPPEKSWANERNIATIEPHKLTPDIIATLKETEWDLFIVASYGKILPETLLAIPKKGVVNVHPSLLPKLRGPSPIRSAILTNEKETGISIMLLDKEMDHGPLLAQKAITISPWPIKGTELDTLLAQEGAELLAETLPLWTEGSITPTEQDHSQATFCKMFQKQDGEINLSDDAYQNFLKINAFDGWPGTYFFHTHGDKKIRVAIKHADFKNGTLSIISVVPEGKKEMSYADFLRGYTN